MPRGKDAPAVEVAVRIVPDRRTHPYRQSRYISLAVGLFLVLLGLPIAYDALPLLPDVQPVWMQPAVWPLNRLEEGPFGILFVVVGALLLWDSWRQWPHRWQRSVVWALAWGALLNLVLYAWVAVLGNGPRRPMGVTAAETALWVAYTLAWLRGQPLWGERRGYEGG